MLLALCDKLDRGCWECDSVDDEKGWLLQVSRLLRQRENRNGDGEEIVRSAYSAAAGWLLQRGSPSPCFASCSMDDTR